MYAVLRFPQPWIHPTYSTMQHYCFKHYAVKKQETLVRFVVNAVVDPERCTNCICRVST